MPTACTELHLALCERARGKKQQLKKLHLLEHFQPSKMLSRAGVLSKTIYRCLPKKFRHLVVVHTISYTAMQSVCRSNKKGVNRFKPLIKVLPERRPVLINGDPGPATQRWFTNGRPSATLAQF